MIKETVQHEQDVRWRAAAIAVGQVHVVAHGNEVGGVKHARSLLGYRVALRPRAGNGQHVVERVFELGVELVKIAA